MSSPGDESDVDGNKRQQNVNQFDAERQIPQPQATSSGGTSKNVFLQRLAKSYSNSLQRFPKLREWIHYQQNNERRNPREYIFPPFSTNLERPSAMDASIYERAGQCCFLCLRKRHNQLAIVVPCFRPTRPRDIEYTTQKLGSSTKRIIYQKIGPKERVGESDAAIFERLKWACFEYQGTWKKWLPFYGVTKVEEVNFQFVGVVENDGTFPIRMTSLDIGKIREEVDKVLSMEPDSMDAEVGDLCTGDGWHGSQCQPMMEFRSKPCIREQISAAQYRQKRLTMLDLLTKCGRCTSEANGMRVLEGMATDSCVYEA